MKAWTIIQPSACRIADRVKSLVESYAVVASAAFRNAIVTSRFFGSGGELIAPAAHSLLQITDLAIIPLGAGVEWHG